MAVADLALLDGRYQLLRRLGGRAATPLMVASDLRRGTVVCLRLRQFSTSIASFAAVPPLSAPAERGVDGPLLPYDFGVDEDVAYLVRDFVPGSTLEHLLSAAEPPALPALVGVLRRAGQALLSAAAAGFPHPGLLPEHILIAADGSVRVTGFDVIGPSVAPTHRAGPSLAGVLRSALAAYEPASLPPALRPLADRPGRRAAEPDLTALVAALVRIESGLDGRTITTGLTGAVRRSVPACAARLRHLGPLLHPYLVLLVLLAGIALLTHGYLSTVSGADRVYVYTVPALATSSRQAVSEASQCSASVPSPGPVVTGDTCVALSLSPPAQQPVAHPAAPAPVVPTSTDERVGATLPGATPPTSFPQQPAGAPTPPSLAAPPPATASRSAEIAPAAATAAPVAQPIARQAFTPTAARRTSAAAPHTALPPEAARGLTTHSAPTARTAMPTRVPASTINQRAISSHTTATSSRTTASSTTRAR